MGLAFACSLVLAGPPPGTPGMVPLAIPAMTLLLLSPGCTSAVFLTAPAACDRRLELGTPWILVAKFLVLGVFPILGFPLRPDILTAAAQS